MLNYNTTLQTNNSSLEEIITQLNNMPEAGSGGSGGGSVETCTVTIIVQAGTLGYLVASIRENNNISPYTYNSTVTSSLTIENVVCGSAMVVSISGLMIIGTSMTGGIERFSQFGGILVFKAPTEAGVVGSVTIYDND